VHMYLFKKKGGENEDAIYPGIKKKHLVNGERE